MLLLDGCEINASVVCLKILHAAKVVVLMFPSHLSHILHALDKDPFLKTNAYARSEPRATLRTPPRNSKFNLANLMRVIKVGAFHGVSSVNISNGFKKTGTWPVSPAEINVGRLLLGKGVRKAARKMNLEQLSTRLVPEARRDMLQPQIAFGSVSTRVLALGATAAAVLVAFEALDAEAARKKAAKEPVQAAKEAKAAAAAALAVRLASEAAVRRSSPEFQERKRSLRERAARERAAAGDVEPKTRVSGAVVEHDTRRKRPRA